MATFAVAVPDNDDYQTLNDFMTKIGIEGEKKSDTLKRIFQVASEHIDGETLKKGGVDVAALDASIENIRTMFLTAVSGRTEIQKACDEKVAEIKAQKDNLESDLRAQIATAKAAQTEAEAAATTAAEAAARATKESKAAEETAETNAALAAEKDRVIAARDATITSQAEQLAAALEKANAFDSLEKAKKDADSQIAALQSQVAMNQKDMERAVSDAQKDAALAQTQAVQEAVNKIREEYEKKLQELRTEAQDDASRTRDEYEEKLQTLRDECQRQLREADAQVARLQAKIELIEQQQQQKKG